MNEFYYLSNPYNGTNEQREARFKICARVTGFLIKNGVYTLSPIVHNHAMLKVYDEFSLEERKRIILDFDFSLLSKSKAMIVLKLEGWGNSFGVGKEIEFCKLNKIPIYYFSEEEIFKNYKKML